MSDRSIIMTPTVVQMLLISENTGSVSVFHGQPCPNFITQLGVNSPVCLEQQRDLVILWFGASMSQSRPVDKVIILVFGHSSKNYYAMPLGLIYCTPRNAQQISFWERDRDRLVCFGASDRSCVYVCVCACVCVHVCQQSNTDEIISRKLGWGEIKSLRRKRLKLQDSFWHPRCPQAGCFHAPDLGNCLCCVVLAVCVCVCV